MKRSAGIFLHVVLGIFSTFNLRYQRSPHLTGKLRYQNDLLTKKLFMRDQFLLIAAFLLFTITSFAQQTVTGKITDSNGSPLAGASVKVKGTSRGTLTDNS